MNAAWSCPTCDAHVKTAYCPGCGEQPPAAHDLTLSGLAHQSLEALGHLDGRSIRTFRSLLTRPGELTADFVRGRRKPYLGPVQVFLLAFTATYFYAASRRVFGVDRVARLLSAAALTVASAAIFYAYRFAVFVITLYTT